MGESEAHKRWQQENTTRLTFRFNNRTDADILDALGTTRNKLAYVKAAIREKLERDKIQK